MTPGRATDSRTTVTNSTHSFGSKTALPTTSPEKDGPSNVGRAAPSPATAATLAASLRAYDSSLSLKLAL